MDICYIGYFGGGDGTDCIEYKKLRHEAEAMRAIMTGTDPNEDPVVREELDSHYYEIEGELLDSLFDVDDPFTKECMGYELVDTDEINGLVKSRDPHALEYFGLTDITDEELLEWDAELCLDEIPNVRDFEEDFEEKSPFECGYEISIFVPYEEPEQQEVEDYLRKTVGEKDCDLVLKVVEAQKDEYPGIVAFAKELAEEYGCDELVKKLKEME